MIRLHWRYFAVCCLLLIPIFSKERTGVRSYLHYLKQQQQFVFGDTLGYHYRVRQIRAESNFNPRATSDFRNWKNQGVDTITAIRSNIGAAGLAQFIWATAQRYNAQSVSTIAADDTTLRADIYNPFWSLQAHCRYMKNIMLLLQQTRNTQARRLFVLNKQFLELCAVSAYNCGERRVLAALKKYTDWEKIKITLPRETVTYAERIVLQ